MFVKTTFYRLAEPFEKNYFFQKKFFEIFYGLLAQKFQPSVNVYWRRCQNCFLKVQRIFFRSNVSKKLLLINFGNWARNFQVMSWIFWQGCQNSNVRVQRNFYRTYVLWSKILLPNTFDMDRKNFGFCRKKLRQVCPNRILPIHRNSPMVNTS